MFGNEESGLQKYATWLIAIGVVLGSVSAIRQAFGYAFEVDDRQIRIRDREMGQVHRLFVNQLGSLVVADSGKLDTFSVALKTGENQTIEIEIQSGAAIDEIVDSIAQYVPCVVLREPVGERPAGDPRNS